MLISLENQLWNLFRQIYSPGMKSKSTLKLPLTDNERRSLRQSKVKLSEISGCEVAHLQSILGVPRDRAKLLRALAEFQTIPSVGIRFAEDLVFLGVYSLEELKGKDGATLTDDFERKKGYWIDPCVEDQFRLVVHCAATNDRSMKWWDFTDERKRFRATYGYPKSRPKAAWYELLGYNFPGAKSANK